MGAHTSSMFVRVGIIAVSALVVAACGSDDPDADDVAPSASETSGDAQPFDQSTTPPATDPPATAPPATAPLATDPPSPGGSSDALCAAFGGMFTAGMMAAFGSVGDEERGMQLLAISLPALSQLWSAAADSFPVADVDPLVHVGIGTAAGAFADAAAKVEMLDLDPTVVATFEELILATASGAEPDPDVEPPEEELFDLITEEQAVALGEIGAELDATLTAFEETVPEIAEFDVEELCPESFGFLDEAFEGSTYGPGGDACAAVTEQALALVFDGTPPPAEPRNDDPSLCEWKDDDNDRDLVVSLIPLELASQQRAAQADDAGLEVIELEGLGDAAWSIPGLMIGLTADGTSFRSGLGSGYATTGVELGDLGLLVGVGLGSSDGLDAGEVAAMVATEIVAATG